MTSVLKSCDHATNVHIAAIRTNTLTILNWLMIFPFQQLSEDESVGISLKSTCYFTDPLEINILDIFEVIYPAKSESGVPIGPSRQNFQMIEFNYLKKILWHFFRYSNKRNIYGHNFSLK